MTDATSGRRPGLDAVRSAAIILVVIGHYVSFCDMGLAPVVYPMATLGVELFFTLSGFLIGGILLRTMSAWKGRLNGAWLLRFWSRRWLRTLPNYYLFLGLWCLFEARPANFTNYVWFGQNLAWPQTPFFSVSWSLTIEEWFYLLFPLLLMLLSQAGLGQRPAFVAVTSGMFTVPLLLSFVMAVGRNWDEVARQIVVLRLDALMFGVAMAYVKQTRPDIFARLCTARTGAVGAAILGGAYLYIFALYHRTTTLDAGVLDIVSLPILDLGSVLMLPFFYSHGLPRGLDWVCTRVSLWSYSLYLCHLPVLEWTYRCNHWYLQDSLTRPHLAWATTALALAASALLYYGFERPILSLRDRWLP